MAQESGPLPQHIQEALHCVTSLAQSGEADEAVELLRQECSHAPASALRLGYFAAVEAYLWKEDFDAACNLVTGLLQQQDAPASDSETAATVLSPAEVPVEPVLRALVRAQLHGRTVEILRAACSASAAPSDAVFNSAVDAAVRARSYCEAWEMLELLLASRRRADKYFVSILTKSLESSSDRKWVRRGIALVDRFISQQREDVDEIVFNSLLNVLGNIGDMTKLQHTLGKMNEYGVSPSAVTYGTVVKAYGRAKDIDSVLKVWEEMRNRCLGVNPVTCGCVLDACVKCGHLDKAMAIFQEMQCKGLHKNTVLYATLIKGLAKVRDLASAVHLYQEMRMEGVPCNLVTFNSLMDVCVRCGDLQTAAFFLQDMMQMRIEPDLITFSTLIKGYSHTGEVHKALALKRELKSRGLRCDEIMYNSLIDGCAKAGKTQEGLEVFEDMLQSRVAPSNITFSILVRLHFDAGLVTEAFRMVDDMAGKYRCTPSRIVYTVLFRCCALHGGVALQRGVALLGELAGRRGSKLLDAGMFSAMVSGCLRHGELEAAATIVRDSFLGGFRRSGGGNAAVSNGAASGQLPVDCLRAVAETLGACDEERGSELVEHLKKKGVPSHHVAQFQAALNEGRRRGVTQPWAVASAVGGTGLDPASDNAGFESYCQWGNASAGCSAVSCGTEPSPMYGYHHGFPQQHLGYYGAITPFVDGGCLYAGDGENASVPQHAAFMAPPPPQVLHPPPLLLPSPLPAPLPAGPMPAAAPRILATTQVTQIPLATQGKVEKEQQTRRPLPAQNLKENAPPGGNRRQARENREGAARKGKRAAAR